MKANSARRSLGLALGLAALTLPAFAEWQSGLRGGRVDEATDPIWKTAEPTSWESYPGPHAATNNVKGANGLWADRRVWVYRGQIKLNGSCWFVKYIDDGAILKIDGNVLIENAGYAAFKTVQTNATGWHDFELRLWNGTGGAGAMNDDKGKLQDGTPCGFGICMNAAEPKKMSECSYPADPGDCSLFRYDDGTGFATEGLLTAVSPSGLPAACEPPAGWKHGLASNDTVECSAPAELLHEGAHYTNNIGCILQTWDAAANDWGAPTTNANNGVYTYTHGAASGKITWPYVRDGWRLDAASLQPRLGSIEVQPPAGSELSGGCYRTGTVVKLTATAQGGSNFIAWREDGTNYSTEAEIEVTMDRAYALRAVFESIALIWAGQNVEWADGGDGWLSADGSSAIWRNGSTAIFTNIDEQVVTITNEGVSAAAVCFEGAAPVTLTGGKLTMVEAAKLVATNAGNVTIETQLAGENGLTIVHGKKAVFTNEITEENQVVFPGTQLADIGLIVGSTCGQNIPADKPYIPCQDRMIENGRRIQFQMYDDGLAAQKTKFVRVLFTQAESGVQAKRLAVNGIAVGKLGGIWVGSDMDREDGVESGPFGIKGLTAQVAPGRFVIKKATAFSGQLTLESGRLEFGPEGKLNENGSFPGAVVNNGMILLPPDTQTFTGPVSGTGRFFVRGEPSKPPAVASFRGKAEWTGGLTVLTNACVDITDNGSNAKVADEGNAFPKTGTVDAYDGGEIRIYKRAGHPNPVHLRRGGALRFKEPSNTYSDYTAIRKIFIEGGTLYATSVLNASDPGDDCRNYVNHLDVLNGGTVEGNPCRVGCMVNAVWRIHGNAPCYQKAGIRLANVVPYSLTLNVDDVTGNENGDLFVSGPLKGGADSVFTINKKGAGTVVFSGTNSCKNCLTKITGGTLRFETDKALGGAGNIIELNGGLLDLGTGTNTPSGGIALSLTAPSRLKPSNGAIAFAAPAEGAWADANTATLTIVGELGEQTVKFGTNQDSLDKGQLEQIKLDGDPQAKFKLDNQGWLCLDKSSGTILILR